MKRKRKTKSISFSPTDPPTHRPTPQIKIQFPFFVLLCNAIIHVKDIKVVHLKKKKSCLYNTRKRIFHPLKKPDKIRIKSKSLMLRKTKQYKF